MAYIKTKINGIEYIVQSYLKGEFVHLTNKITSIIILFQKKTFGSWNKENKVWYELTSKMKVEEIEIQIDSLMQNQKINKPL